MLNGTVKWTFPRFQDLCLPQYNSVQSDESQPTFRRSMSLPSPGSKIRAKKTQAWSQYPAEQVKYSSDCYRFRVGLFAWLILTPWRWRRHVLPKRGLTFNRLQGIIPQTTRLLLTNAVRTSDPRCTIHLSGLRCFHAVIFRFLGILLYSYIWK
jgi:hypothetical protein